jgi:hypothetical protein
LTHLSVRINGREYESGNLQANQTAHFDARLLMNLEKNSIVFVGQGETGSFANIAVSDTAPAVQGRNQNPARKQDAGVWGALGL